MRTAVDFFVGLIYGQIVIVVTAVVTLGFDGERREYLAVGALAAVIITVLAYHGAVVATDEWAYSVQALVNAGRGPVAQGLSLKLPATLEEEQKMWTLLGRLLSPEPDPETLELVDQYRVAKPTVESRARKPDG